MSKNKTLSAAKSAKNDEFYTQYADIQKEINAYLDYDALNRPTSRNADTFGYNDRSEVTNAIVSGQTEFHVYDEIGNSIWGGTISNGYSYVSNSRNQYSEVLYAGDWGCPSDSVESAYDAYGNILGYRDAQGNVVASYVYDAFGNTINRSGPMADSFVFRFSTKYFDADCDLYYYGYRYYKPQIMCWLTEDPIGEDGGLNLYAMCENDTVLYHDALGEARMITGSLFALKGTKRIIFSGYNHARNIIRLVDKLNSLYVGGQKVYDAKICDLVTTPISSLKKEIAANANNVYIIAHGGLVINNKVFRGRHYLWNESDSVDERIFPTGKPPGIDVHSLGVNMDNVFGCYLSAAVRKVPSRTFWRTQYTSSVDDYGRMYEALYSRLARYAVNPQPSKCPVRIRIFEGENANESNKSYAETENALRKYPIRDEEEYK